MNLKMFVLYLLQRFNSVINICGLVAQWLKQRAGMQE